MIKNLRIKFLITFLVLISISLCVKAESLFTLGASQTYAPVPKSLYGGVQARSVGDLISIIMDETVVVTNKLTYNSNKESSTTDNFSAFFNTVLGRHLINDHLGTFGGSNAVANSADTSSKLTFGDKIAVQVVQQMPNGNLVVQGKKTIVNGNERADLIVTGIVDPRWITSTGQVYSKYVANLQFAMSGRGSISRSGNEGIINRFIKYLF
ncbi:MAG: flagellar basal body L-ring protein FlgH [Candidatus Gastranaerophilales bacterium]|nr:flagellar basal body L-ring protein FlgH [Candidatus Gastranaerophilales bacterium]